MQYIALALLALLACTPPSSHLTTLITSTPECEKRTVGEACGCGCIAPSTCIEGTCLLSKLEDGQGCVQNSQCLNGSCEEGRCQRTNVRVGVYDCHRTCNTAEKTGCTTRCSFG